jgi:hypothetical protein
MSLMDQEKLLRSATGWQRRGRQTTSRAGVNANAYLQTRQRQLGKSAAIVDVWQEVLPPQFYEHCTLAKITGDAIYVEVDPGPYMHEMKLLNTELIEHIRNRCPGSGIKKIILRPRKSTG